MKITESITLTHSAAKVWGILQNPSNMPAWNPKCCSCDGNDNAVIGSRFEATFKLGREAQVMSCEVVRLMPYEKITIRYSGTAFRSKNGFVDETFLLTKQGQHKTKVKLEVDFKNSGLPSPVKCIMWFISTFGYKVGRSSLDGLKDLMEYN
jgi:carbon monoxide dehydrogenase subunit G